MNLPKYLNDKTLVFIDIEATDYNENRKMIQFSGIKVFVNGKNEYLDILINPQQELSNHIINLLKIDDYTLSKYPTFNEISSKILNFIQDCVIVYFGDFDYEFLVKCFKNESSIELDLPHFNLQSLIKNLTKSQASLTNLHKLITRKYNSSLVHNALYDAIMLKNIYYSMIKMNEEEFTKICELSHLIPKNVYPKHLIFSEKDFNHVWKNYPNIKNEYLLVDELKIDFLKIKDKKITINIPYIVDMKYVINNHKYQFHNSYLMGAYTYEYYLNDIAKFLFTFLKELKFRPLFLLNVSKEKIQYLSEIIYDSTHKYINLKFINLNYLIKKDKNCDDYIKMYIDLLKNQPHYIQNNYYGFNIWNNKLK